jgi:hypothetical protein
MQAMKRILLGALLAGGGTACTWVSDDEHRARLRALDADDDGFIAQSAGGDDCDDHNPRVNPDAPERCDTPDDDDCDGVANGPDAIDVATFHRDRDGDGWGGPDSVRACAPPDGHVANSGDCEDGDPMMNPGAPEVCPGLGLPDLDCDPTPRACEASADALIPVLTAPGAGSFVEDQGALLEVVDGELFRWEPGSLAGQLATRAPADSVGPGAGRLGPVALRGAWLAVARGEAPGEVWWRKLGAWSAAGVVEAANDRSKSFGQGLAWADDGLLAALEVGNSGQVELVLVDLGAELDTGEARTINGGAASLVAGGDPGQRLLVATQPDRRGGGLVVLGAERNDDVEITGAGLGSYGLTVADVDGDRIPDVLASTAEAVYVWRGPFEDDRTLDDAWWTLPIDRPAHTIVVADLGGDGRQDLVLGSRDGGGAAEVYLDIPSRPAAPWATVLDGAGGFGASIGVTTLAIEGAVTQAIVFGDPGRGRIVALPWR